MVEDGGRWSLWAFGSHTVSVTRSTTLKYSSLTHNSQLDGTVCGNRAYSVTFARTPRVPAVWYRAICGATRPPQRSKKKESSGFKMSTPSPPVPTTYSKVSYDGELLSLQWEGTIGENYVVEVRCPSWGSTYCTNVDQPSVMLGVSGSRVEYRVGVKGHMLPDFLSIDGPSETPGKVAEPELLLDDAPVATLSSEAPAAAAPVASDAAWLQSLGVDALLAEALGPLGAGQTSLGPAMGALDEATVAARLREADIAAVLARALVAGGKDLLPATTPASDEATTPVELATPFEAATANESPPPAESVPAATGEAIEAPLAGEPSADA